MARVSRSAYLESALDVLAQAGSEGLTVAGLCSRLGVTKGSFYHHFAGMPEFVTALLEFWEDQRSQRLIAASRAEPDPRARYRLLLGIAVGLPHAAEASLRAWGRSNAEVRAVVARVDEARERHLTESMMMFGLPAERARLRARIAIAVLVGAQQREDPVDVDGLRAMLEELSAELPEGPSDETYLGVCSAPATQPPPKGNRR
ncbi:TetR/AcrR family transcriptional regulator [Pseudonocardia acaciae]|uniref:TetR/AcrR family transcriptional regulator n=1 Tax=Pseudonocardia acaciae TaxID=551276 RepID=UPI000685264A|nr:TetR/AcrR family transcriptional regulator [Pseudonocardia acaciae]